MMDWTDRHYRYFMRVISREVLLYTEMVTTGAILFGDAERHLAFSSEERPLALQLGGDKPEALARCAKIAQDYGYDEVNLNVGCPSDRVQNGNFGACLMAQPELVRECMQAVREAVRLPISVKHRLGIDDMDDYYHMAHFVGVVAEAGVDKFTVHARKAWLQGLSPKENRSKPPLNYPSVYRLKREFPHLFIEINGGIRSFEAAREHLEQVDAVMIGRAAYEDPYMFARADQTFFANPHPVPSRRDIITAMLPYAEAQCQQGVYIKHISRHMLQLFAGKPGAKAWKRYLSENAHKPGTGPELLSEAMALISDEVLDM